MLKRKNLQIFFDGTLNIKTFGMISLKTKKFIFYAGCPFLMLKNHRLQITNLVKNSVYRKKYF